MKKRLYGLDGIRGGLALIVSLSHALGHLTGWNSGLYLFDNVDFAVDVFFCMSGIVLIYAYKDKVINGDISVLRFFQTRFLRLAPLHFFMMIFSSLALYFSFGNLAPEWTKFNIPNDLLSDIFLVNSLGIYFDSSINHPSWSISVELWIGTILFLIFVKIQPLIYVLTIVFAYAIYTLPINLQYGAEHLVPGLSHGSLRGLYSISIGMICFSLIEHTKTININHISYYVSAVFISVLCVLWQFEINTAIYLLFIPLVSIALSLLTKLPKDNVILELLETELFKWLGKHSFTIYLTHIPVIYFFYHFKSDNINHNLILSILAVLTTTVISPYIHKNIELRFINYGKDKNCNNMLPSNN
ncbi:acyltransferase [Photobacterium sp. MCCC 1A19761]|uniref:acyltransferase family protein n=1 Tax=Photobacterium sp. MCCC 1A19761 TaxID=3115000 RepID=UPI00307D2933